jgi:hypothetical protein
VEGIKMSKEISEIEIKNFALDFVNLINSKNNEISQLKGENIRLRAAITQLSEPDRRLTEKEVREGERPVYAFHLNRVSFQTSGTIGWVVPLRDGIGVINNRKGVYHYSDYGRTWYALSAFDAKAAERLIVLPCKVGDTVYWIWCDGKGNPDGDIREENIQYFYIDKDGLGIATKYYDGHIGHYTVDGELVDGVRRIYLSRCAAEKAIK